MEEEKAEILRRIIWILEQEGLITKEELIRMMALLPKSEGLDFAG